jgi:endonuclease G
VSYRLTARHVALDSDRDLTRFQDDVLSFGWPTREDYRGSGFVPAPLAPPEDVRGGLWPGDAYRYSNTVPQLPEFYRGPWLEFERAVRRVAQAYGEVWVMAGPIVPVVPQRTQGAGGVVVPSGFFKIVARRTPEGLDVAAFRFDHVRIFHELPYDREAEIEHTWGELPR